jgi:hypothetical protein
MSKSAQEYWRASSGQGEVARVVRRREFLVALAPSHDHGYRIAKEQIVREE